jgi:rhodanese-related sulfurtransferase
MTQGTALGQTAEVARMTIEELKAHMGAPDVVILDVRADGDWKNSDEKIKGAVRENPKEVQAWAAKYSKDKRLVLYCA